LLTPEIDQDAFAQRLVTIDGLENGKQYEFKVSAKNIADDSDESSSTFIVGTEPAPPKNVKTARSGDATEVVISWTNAASVGVLKVSASSVFVKDSKDNFLDAAEYCEESTAAANRLQKCTISMSDLGRAPFRLTQGDDVYAKVSSTNMIGTSRLSDEGEGATYTLCPNGAPDRPVDLEHKKEFRTSSSFKVSFDEGDCDGNYPVEDFTVYYKRAGESEE
jgi:hypothetical protein